MSNHKKHKKRHIFLGVIIVVLVVVFVGFLFAQRKNNNPDAFSFVNQVSANYEKCFYTEYTLNNSAITEKVYLSFSNNHISGNKRIVADSEKSQLATSLEGSYINSDIKLKHHYTVNGFPKTENEHYTINEDGNLVKHEYLLEIDDQTGELAAENSEVIGTTMYYAMKCAE